MTKASTLRNEVVGTYQYDHRMRRIEKATVNATTRFVYDLFSNILVEGTDEHGTDGKEYIYVNGERLAARMSNGTMLAYHNDHLGTPQVVTDQNANVVWSAWYEPFGTVTENIAIIKQPLRFPGQYEDEETGLVQNWYREYYPKTGRYLQAEKMAESPGYMLTMGAGAVQIALYGYAAGNPAAYVDDTGMLIYITGATAEEAFNTMYSNLTNGEKMVIDHLRTDTDYNMHIAPGITSQKKYTLNRGAMSGPHSSNEDQCRSHKNEGYTGIQENDWDLIYDLGRIGSSEVRATGSTLPMLLYHEIFGHYVEGRMLRRKHPFDDEDRANEIENRYRSRVGVVPYPN